MLDLGSLLRARSAYAGRFDASGRHLVFVGDLGAVPQVWGVVPGGWPSLQLAPPDRAQTVHPGPQPGQLAAGVDVGGNEHTQLLYLAPNGTLTPLTDSPEHIHSFGGWSRDGQRFSFAANTRSSRWFDVYVRDLASGETRRVLEHDSSNRAGRFSPDGRWLLSLRSHSLSHQELWLLEVAGNEPPRLLSEAGQEALYQGAEWSADGAAVYVLTDLGRDLAAPARLDLASGKLDFLVEPELDVDESTVDPTGRRLAYACNRDGAVELHVRTLATGDDSIIAGLPPGALYAYWQSALAWSADGEQLAIAWSSSRMPANVWAWSAADGVRQVTHAGGIGLDPDQLTEPEHVRFPSFDGRQIPGLYYRPASSNGSGPPPCVLVVHGGPESQYRPTFQPLVQYLVSAGLAVLAPNVRGSTGYGRAYMDLDNVRKRMDSVADLAHAVAWLRDSGRADPQRVGIYGGSYGGFMVLSALTTYPELWAAGVDVVGIANFVSFLENTGPWRRHLREAEYGSLEHDRDFLEQISPINHVDRICAPLLVIHGANDPRVPIGEAEQIVSRLRELGRSVDFLRLDDEGHQIAKLKNKLVAYPLAAEFLRRHLRAD